MARDPIEVEAMLIRKQAADSLMNEVDGLKLLTMIVAPSESLLQQSLAEARERGPSPMALRLARKEAELPVGRDAARSHTKRLHLRRVAKREHSRFATLDELLAS
jgi:hypothetical protein